MTKLLTVSPVGFFRYAETYFEAALYLEEGHSSGDLALTEESPIDFLFGHAIEMFLKSLLLGAGRSQSDVKGFNHNIPRLFQELKSNQSTEELIRTLERDFRAHWKSLLREMRDEYASSLPLDAGEEFGVYDNETIGQGLPELAQTIEGIYAISNNSRYFEKRYLRLPAYVAFGKSVSVLRESEIWMCSELKKLKNHRLISGFQ